MAERERLRQQELWIAWIRLCAVVWAVLEVGLVSHDYPEGYRTYAWIVTGVLGAGALVIAWVARRGLSLRGQLRLGLGALVFDTAIVYAYFAIYQFELGLPTRGLVYLAVIEAAVRFGIRGGVGLPLATLPALVAVEWFRADRFGDGRHRTCATSPSHSGSS